MPEKLIVERKKLKGEDGHRVFSVRLTEETVEKLEAIAEETNRSRNELRYRKQREPFLFCFRNRAPKIRRFSGR